MSYYLSNMKGPIKFLGKFAIIFLGWYFLDIYGFFDNSGANRALIKNLILNSQEALNDFGFATFSELDVVGLSGTYGVQIGPPCNGLDLMALFLGILILLPGSWIKKSVYGVAGLLTIHLLNLLRVILLIIILKWNPEVLQFNHDYTFTLIMYVIIFLMWVGWMRLQKHSVEKK